MKCNTAYKVPIHSEFLSWLLVHFPISSPSTVFPINIFYNNMTLEIASQYTRDFSGMYSFNINNRRELGMNSVWERGMKMWLDAYILGPLNSKNYHIQQIMFAFLLFNKLYLLQNFYEKCKYKGNARQCRCLQAYL